MHIGLVIYGSLETVSGGYLYDRFLVDHLRRAGDTVEIISLPWRDYARHLTDNFSAGLLKQLSDSSFDLLLQDELNHPSLFRLNRRLRQQVDYPLVAIVHHLRSSEARPAWQNALYRQVERRYLESVDAFIFNSRTTQGVVGGLVGSQRPAVVAYPAGNRWQASIDPALIIERAHRPGPLRILFIGNLIPRKGLHTLLDALDRLPPAVWHLTVVGSNQADPTYARAMEQRVLNSGKADQIDLIGTLFGDALVDCFMSSHLLVVPSSYEGFGIVYLEGMGFGLPAIATTAGAAAEIITQGRDGLLIEPGDSAALAEHIASLAADRERLIAMSLAARERFARHPTWEQSMARIRAFLEHLLAHDRSGGKVGIG